MTDDQAQTTSTRGDALLATRNRKMAALFQDKVFLILNEVHLTGDEVFRTPFGHKGRNGFVLQQVTDRGATLESYTPVALEADQDWEGGKKAGEPNAIVIGASVLKVANEDYGSIINMPDPPARRRGRGKDQAEEGAQEPETVGA